MYFKSFFFFFATFQNLARLCNLGLEARTRSCSCARTRFCCCATTGFCFCATTTPYCCATARSCCCTITRSFCCARSRPAPASLATPPLAYNGCAMGAQWGYPCSNSAGTPHIRSMEVKMEDSVGSFSRNWSLRSTQGSGHSADMRPAESLLGPKRSERG